MLFLSSMVKAVQHKLLCLEISFVKLLDYARIGALVVAWTAADQKALEKFKSKENENFNIEILTSEELAEITPGMSDVSVNRMQANAIVRPLYKIKTRNLECYKCLCIGRAMGSPK